MIIQKKIINIFLLLSVFLFSLSGCGFTPMYSQKNLNSKINIYVSDINISGDRTVNRIIQNNLAYLTNKTDAEKFRVISLIITNNVVRKINTKNAKGKAAIYNLKLTTVAQIIENDVAVSKRTFEKDFNYNSNENIFELEQYEKIIKNNLGTQSSNEIIKFLINYKGS
jgi:outer membrane lipopolysaccharide assembly protein LptE/RlpB